MSSPPTGPLSRSVNVERLNQERAEITVEASPEECAALARAFKIPEIRDLVGRFRLSGSLTRLHVGGSVAATVTQVCTVTLEPFEAKVEEPVDVAFTNADILSDTDAEDVELPDPIVNGRGSVKIGDSIWRVEGPELPKGTRVRVLGADGTLLKVTPA